MALNLSVKDGEKAIAVIKKVQAKRRDSILSISNISMKMGYDGDLKKETFNQLRKLELQLNDTVETDEKFISKLTQINDAIKTISLGQYKTDTVKKRKVNQAKKIKSKKLDKKKLMV